MAALSLPTNSQNLLPTMLRLSDDTSPSRICLVKDDGTYAVIVGIDELRIESFGKMKKMGDYLVLEEVTPRYRVLLVANIKNQTGKLIVDYTGVGQLTILDRKAE